MDYNPRQQRHRAESCQNDCDGKFSFLLIAFNAAKGQAKFQKAKQQANVALAKQQTNKTVELVLTKLYTLRNQIIHGVAWNSQFSFSQLNDDENLLGNPKALWGEANYSVVEYGAITKLLRKQHV
jgi:hypothetical protein